MRYFTEDHQWLSLDGAVATVGITPHAQDALGDVVFVELPAVGRELAQREVAAVVESVKAAADVYTPVSGRVLAVNEDLRQDPALANSDPQGAGWFFQLQLTAPEQVAGLMDEAAYQAFSQNA